MAWHMAISKEYIGRPHTTKQYFLIQYVYGSSIQKRPKLMETCQSKNNNNNNGNSTISTELIHDLNSSWPQLTS